MRPRLRRPGFRTVRARLAAIVVGLCALALSATILLATVLLQNVLTDRIDSQLRSAAEMSVVEPPEAPVGETHLLPPLAGSPEAPRVYFYSDGSEFVRAFGDGASEADFPALTGLGDLAERSESKTPFTVEDVDGNAWRVLVDSESGDGGYAVLALSVEPVSAATENLLMIGGGVVLAILAVLAFAAFWVVRIGLKPLDRMASTAAEIAAGKLDERVDDTDRHTETGRLGRALNAMLARIQTAMGDREASEAKLRQFLADASHELRSPLTSIQGFAQLYRRGGAPPGPALDETIGRIEAESHRMRLLLDDLMLLASLDRERPLEEGPVDLLGVCADAVGDAHVREAGRFVSLEPLAVGAGEFMEAVDLTGDEPRLRQVVTNLVANALRHTPAEAQVAVRVGWSGEPGPPCDAQVGDLPSMPAAVVEVADTGPGVAPEHAEAVFERLYRVDPSRARAGGEGGSGLGLSIVAAIVTGHGGCVRLSETPGGGATFRVMLPGG